MPNKRTEKNKDPLPAKPPEILQKLKWVHMYGGKYKIYILVASLLIALSLIIKYCPYTDKEVALTTNSSKEAQKSQETKPDSDELLPRKKVKSLYELFYSDCQRTQLLREFHLKSKKHKHSPYTFRYIICTDFKPKVFYLYLYLPKSDLTFDACKWLATGYKNLLNGNLKKLLEGMIHQAPGEAAETYAELTFSGRVYIYHETDILPSKIEILTDLYKKSGVSAQFRGRDYEIMKNSPLYDNRY